MGKPREKPKVAQTFLIRFEEGMNTYTYFAELIQFVLSRNAVEQSFDDIDRLTLAFDFYRKATDAEKLEALGEIKAFLSTHPSTRGRIVVQECR